MTRYSASRGIRYTAPPGPDGKRRDADEEDAEEPSAAAVEADGSGGARAADD